MLGFVTENANFGGKNSKNQRLDSRTIVVEKKLLLMASPIFF